MVVVVVVGLAPAASPRRMVNGDFKLLPAALDLNPAMKEGSAGIASTSRGLAETIHGARGSPVATRPASDQGMPK